MDYYDNTIHLIIKLLALMLIGSVKLILCIQRDILKILCHWFSVNLWKLYICRISNKEVHYFLDIHHFAICNCILDSSLLPSSPHTPSSSSGVTTAHHSTTKRTPLERRANKRNERGETQLHLVAIKGDSKQAKQLIKAGADVNVKDFAGT